MAFAVPLQVSSSVSESRVKQLSLKFPETDVDSDKLSGTCRSVGLIQSSVNGGILWIIIRFAGDLGGLLTGVGVSGHSRRPNPAYTPPKGSSGLAAMLSSGVVAVLVNRLAVVD